MGRPSNRAERRAQILSAFARVLADHGYAGATIAAVAAEADIAPGLVHHHFDSKDDLLGALLQDLIRAFRKRVQHQEDGEGKDDPLLAYVDGALKLDARADVTAARCWVGLFAEAVRNPGLFKQVRRLIDTEVGSIQKRSGGEFDPHQAGAVLAFIIGSLVMGAFAPKKTSGFAAPGLTQLVEAMRLGGGDAEPSDNARAAK
jgi:TetR/AcrR family transcriptional repressor of bet genes